MASDANIEEPDDRARDGAPDDADGAGGTGAAAAADDPSRDEDTAAAGDSATEVASKGRTGFFLALTCGFLVCLCCLGTCFTGVSVGLTRMANLEAALEQVGEPDGWETRDQTLWPWSASAKLSGPAEAAVVSDWLAGLGVDSSADQEASCMAEAEPCAQTFEVEGFNVEVEYGSNGNEGYADVLIN